MLSPVVYVVLGVTGKQSIVSLRYEDMWQNILQCLTLFVCIHAWESVCMCTVPAGV